MNISFGWLVGLAVLGGFGVGVLFCWVIFERWYNTMLNVEEMLKQFKSEGHDNKWLK